VYIAPDSYTACYPLMGTLIPYSSGPLYSNTVIGTLAVDGWAVTFGTAKRGLGLGTDSNLQQCSEIISAIFLWQVT